MNDGSRDRTLERLEDIVAQRSAPAGRRPRRQLRRGRRAVRRLRGGARRRWWSRSTATGRTIPHDIPKLLAKLDEGYDVVSGRRRAREEDVRHAGAAVVGGQPAHRARHRRAGLRLRLRAEGLSPRGGRRRAAATRHEPVPARHPRRARRRAWRRSRRSDRPRGSGTLALRAVTRRRRLSRSVRAAAARAPARAGTRDGGRLRLGCGRPRGSLDRRRLDADGGRRRGCSRSGAAIAAAIGHNVARFADAQRVRRVPREEDSVWTHSTRASPSWESGTGERTSCGRSAGSPARASRPSAISTLIGSRQRGPSTPACACTDDFAALIARADVDAIVIATPPSRHHAMALAALRAGKHVWVEKPLALAGGGRPRAGRRRRSRRPGAVRRRDLPLRPAGARDEAHRSTTALWATSCTSPSSASAWAASGATRTCGGTRRRTTSRSSSTSCRGR